MQHTVAQPKGYSASKFWGAPLARQTLGGDPRGQVQGIQKRSVEAGEDDKVVLCDFEAGGHLLCVGMTVGRTDAEGV